jgi:flagellar hook protein FlgE
MSLMTALYAGASGLEASSLELSVVGDNIANGNTIGFKGSRAAFADAMAQNLVGGATGGGGQRGLGAKLQIVQKILTQGSLVNTGLATDLGIEGNGFFSVRGSHNGSEGTFYTRAGQFTVNEDGYLVNLQNLRVQGYMADSIGNISGANVSDLQVGNAGTSPHATTSITLKANLDANAIPPNNPMFDPADPGDTSNFVTGVTIYDSLGKAHQAEVYFRKTSAGAWEWHALTDGANLTGGTTGTATEIASGSMTFGTEGQLLQETQTSGFNPLGAEAQPLAFNFGDPTNLNGTGLAGITQFAAASSTNFTNQDGYDSGTLTRIAINTQGQVMGIFTNGQTRALGQVALTNFQSPDQLARLGGNTYAQTRESGAPTTGEPATGARGQIIAGALEQSNVDMASEFIRMISSQRSFQANSKTLTTADTLLAELMTIKR